MRVGALAFFSEVLVFCWKWIWKTFSFHCLFHEKQVNINI